MGNILIAVGCFYAVALVVQLASATTAARKTKGEVAEAPNPMTAQNACSDPTGY